MAWDWVKRWLKKESGEPAASPPLPGIGWLAPAENPWGVFVFDVRPVTLDMLSTSRDQQCAVNALSFQQDDGTGFVGGEPPVKRTASAALRFRIDRVLADGALFLPREMEHKWALYFHRRQILCIRSWLRQVQAVAQVQVEGDVSEVTAIQGVFAAEDEEPAFTARVLDYLLRSHALGLVYPAPLPPGMEADPPAAFVGFFAIASPWASASVDGSGRQRWHGARHRRVCLKRVGSHRTRRTIVLTVRTVVQRSPGVTGMARTGRLPTSKKCIMDLPWSAHGSQD